MEQRLRPKPDGLMDQVRDAIRVRQYSIRTEEVYTQWIRRSIFFHNKKHPGNWVSLKFPRF